MDFAISMLLFTFTIVIYFSYTNNLQHQEKEEIDLMLKDAKAISSSLSLEGYPDNWSNTTVIRIGVSDNQKINGIKLKKFKQINYTISKKKFATSYDYFIYFSNNNDEILNVNGICGIGYPLINLSYNIKSAYYYFDESESLLRDFMNQTFKADIYKGDISGLSSNLSKYGLLVMEHPSLSAVEFNNNKAKLENYSSRGGLLMLNGELAIPPTNTMVGVDFNKKSGQSSSQRTAIINNTDPYLTFTVWQSMIFNQYYYVTNNSDSSSFNIIGTFNQSDDKAIARWKYGNGTVYFFNDFGVSNFNGNFVDTVEESAKSLIEGTCNPINLSISISPKNLVKTERYLNYNSKIVKMVVYVWQ